MMGLRIVKQEEVELEQGSGSEGYGHGLKVMVNLLEGWTPRGIVCADSYFASVQAAVVLATFGWRFIGVVKTATKLFPQAYLSSVQLPTRGSCVSLTATNHEHKLNLLAFVFCDRNRQYLYRLAQISHLVLLSSVLACSKSPMSRPTKIQRWWIRHWNVLRRRRSNTAHAGRLTNTTGADKNR